MIEHFDAIAILHHSGLLVHGGHLVAKISLDGGDVGNFKDSTAPAIAGDGKNGGREAE
jgi:hypothetical protein